MIRTETGAALALAANRYFDIQSRGHVKEDMWHPGSGSVKSPAGRQQVQQGHMVRTHLSDYTELLYGSTPGSGLQHIFH